MVCEQTNFWACKYKFASTKMNWLRFNFFFTIVFDLFNETKIKQPKESKKNLDKKSKSTLFLKIFSKSQILSNLILHIRLTNTAK
jgi:hypothetical protein